MRGGGEQICANSHMSGSADPHRGGVRRALQRALIDALEQFVCGEDQLFGYLFIYRLVRERRSLEHGDHRARDRIARDGQILNGFGHLEVAVIRAFDAFRR